MDQSAAFEGCERYLNFAFTRSSAEAMPFQKLVLGSHDHGDGSNLQLIDFLLQVRREGYRKPFGVCYIRVHSIESRASWVSSSNLPV